MMLTADGAAQMESGFSSKQVYGRLQFEGDYETAQRDVFREVKQRLILVFAPIASCKSVPAANHDIEPYAAGSENLVIS